MQKVSYVVALGDNFRIKFRSYGKIDIKTDVSDVETYKEANKSKYNNADKGLENDFIAFSVGKVHKFAKFKSNCVQLLRGDQLFRLQ